MRTTALGYAICIHPSVSMVSGMWDYVMMRGDGHWVVMCSYPNEAEAKKARSECFRRHRKLKAERQRQKRKQL